MRRIPVSLKSRSYPIYLGEQSLYELPQILQRHRLGSHIFIVTQKNIWSHWKKQFQEILKTHGISFKVFCANSGKNSEKMKQWDCLGKVLMEASKFDKKHQEIAILALGGGVVGDVGGFAASVYRRGCKLLHVPTTLTAQVDSSIGGKTAIDLSTGKNMVGTIYQPSAVLMDMKFLDSLPNDNFVEGMAEVIKYAIIKDPSLLKFLEINRKKILSRDGRACEKIISVCARIKAGIVSRDEFDTKGVRAFLNFGHTTGHALEAALGYKHLSHGQAVAIGMVVACRLSVKLGLLKKPEVVNRVTKLVSQYGLPVKINSKSVSLKKVMEAMKLDKKRVSKQNCFVLISDIGKPKLFKGVPSDLIEEEVLRVINGSASKKKKSSNDKGNIFSAFFGSKSNKNKNQPQSVRKPIIKAGDQSEVVGRVEAYLGRIRVAIITVTGSAIKSGDSIRIKGPRGEVRMTIRSMQVDHKPVEQAIKGQVVGLRVPKRCSKGDAVLSKSI